MFNCIQCIDPFNCGIIHKKLKDDDLRLHDDIENIPELLSFGQFHLLAKKNKEYCIKCYHGIESNHKCLGIKLHNNYIIAVLNDPKVWPTTSNEKIFTKIYYNNRDKYYICENSYKMLESKLLEDFEIIYELANTKVIQVNNNLEENNYRKPFSLSPVWRDL
jgi:hypothetical protein